MCTDLFYILILGLRSGRRPSPLSITSPTSTVAATAVEPLFGNTATSQGRSKDLNSMAALLMAAATGQTVDNLHMQEFDYEEVEEAKATSEIAPTPREETPRVGTPVPLDVRREIAGSKRKERTARQLAQAVAANAQKLTSHAMHLSRELKVLSLMVALRRMF